jgi:hypothetical protein
MFPAMEYDMRYAFDSAYLRREFDNQRVVAQAMVINNGADFSNPKTASETEEFQILLPDGKSL